MKNKISLIRLFVIVVVIGAVFSLFSSSFQSIDPLVRLKETKQEEPAWVFCY